jgi:hypothetical protein
LKRESGNNVILLAKKRKRRKKSRGVEASPSRPQQENRTDTHIISAKILSRHLMQAPCEPATNRASQSSAASFPIRVRQGVRGRQRFACKWLSRPSGLARRVSRTAEPWALRITNIPARASRLPIRVAAKQPPASAFCTVSVVGDNFRLLAITLGSCGQLCWQSAPDPVDKSSQR